MALSRIERGTVSADEISATHVKEVDFEVPHPYNIEKTWGMGKIRDTIFISAKQDGFEVTNNKWRLNDYDDLGGQSLEFEEAPVMRRDPTVLKLIPASLDPLPFLP